jgi:hypothetical protein
MRVEQYKVVAFLSSLTIIVLQDLGDRDMTVNDALEIASRIESLIRRTDMFGKSKSDILEELLYMANDMRAYADRLDKELYDQYINDMAINQERYDDAIVSRW